jgi:hypothetical protein
LIFRLSATFPPDELGIFSHSADFTYGLARVLLSHVMQQNTRGFLVTIGQPLSETKQGGRVNGIRAFCWPSSRYMPQ